MNNHTPTQKQFDKVIGNFKRILTKRKVCEVNMMGEPQWLPMCHAGWYGSLFTKKNEIFRFGEDLIANHLGFNSSSDLKHWAHMHPKIWGNRSGFYMFCSSSAFNVVDNLGMVEDLTQIVDHWICVKERALNETVL